MNERSVTADHGVLRVEQHLRVSGMEIGTDITGPAVVCARFEVLRGRVVYLRDRTKVVAPRFFSVVLPPFSVVQARLERCEIRMSGVAFRPATRDGLPSTAVLLHDTDVLERDWSSDRRPLERQREIGRVSNAHPAATAAKAILDAEYASGSAIIGDIAKRLEISASALARIFERSFGIQPVRYRHYLRVMDALLRFADGAAPIDVYQDVGFEDLSRFYSAFRTIACSPPGPYRAPRSKNAKTRTA